MNFNKKYLFLDLDGVANTEEYIGRAAFHSKIYSNLPLIKEELNFNNSSIELLKKLQQEYNLNVVIASNWRFGIDDKTNFIKMFQLFDWNLESIDTLSTQISERSVFKENHENCYYRSYIINEYRKKYNIKADQFIIIDDTKELYNYADGLENNLILTDRKYGFTKNDYTKAVELLNKQNNGVIDF